LLLKRNYVFIIYEKLVLLTSLSRLQVGDIGVVISDAMRHMKIYIMPVLHDFVCSVTVVIYSFFWYIFLNLELYLKCHTALVMILPPFL
jgi:hypothetical protein